MKSQGKKMQLHSALIGFSETKMMENVKVADWEKRREPESLRESGTEIALYASLGCENSRQRESRNLSQVYKRLKSVHVAVG